MTLQELFAGRPINIEQVLDKLARVAAELGLPALAVADRNSVAGVVRAHQELREIARVQGAAPKLIPGAGGVFDVRVDGQLVFSKHETGNFPDEEALLQHLAQPGA